MRIPKVKKINSKKIVPLMLMLPKEIHRELSYMAERVQESKTAVLTAFIRFFYHCMYMTDIEEIVQNYKPGGLAETTPPEED